jgi:hypothetical protein
MSGRDYHLKGLGNPWTLLKRANQIPCLHVGDGLGKLVNVANILHAGPVEMFNAVYLYMNFVDYKHRDTDLIFLVCLRLSIFARRRRDIISKDHDAAIRIMNSAKMTHSDIQYIEADIFRKSRFIVWEPGSNVYEVVYLLSEFPPVDAGAERILSKVCTVALSIPAIPLTVLEMSIAISCIYTIITDSSRDLHRALTETIIRIEAIVGQELAKPHIRTAVDMLHDHFPN